MTELYIIEARGVEHTWTGCVRYLSDIAPTLVRTVGEQASAVVTHWQRDKTALEIRNTSLIYDPNWYGGELCGWVRVERFQWPVTRG